jgi:hypothetical protein
VGKTDTLPMPIESPVIFSLKIALIQLEEKLTQREH